jgi:hypothetical protein
MNNMRIAFMHLMYIFVTQNIENYIIYISNYMPYEIT